MAIIADRRRGTSPLFLKAFNAEGQKRGFVMVKISLESMKSIQRWSVIVEPDPRPKRPLETTTGASGDAVVEPQGTPRP